MIHLVPTQHVNDLSVADTNDEMFQDAPLSDIFILTSIKSSMILSTYM